MRRLPIIAAGLVALTAAVAAACAPPPLETGPPVDDPAALADGVAAASGPAAPSRIRFRWEYADDKGRLAGEGVARVNPPDSFRLDLFSSAEGSMAAALVDGRLSTLGQIEDVELPAPPFLYGMAGLFRPGATQPAEGFRVDGDVVLVYRVSEGTERRVRLREGRIIEMEERDGRRTLRRIRVSWPETPAPADGPAEAEGGAEDAPEGQPPGAWPVEAEYRDHVAPSRVRWTLEESRTEEAPFPGEIYDLGASP